MEPGRRAEGEAVSGHTPGPWRWEVSGRYKRVTLCGGRPLYDLTVMEFARWGMSNAQPAFREIEDGMDLLHKLSEKPNWITPILGREHHSDWCATIEHPDAVLIAAAPELLAALKEMLDITDQTEPEPCYCDSASPCDDCLAYTDRRRFLRSVIAIIAKAEGKS